ncbi:MAG TPA: hypothetical protein VGK97_01810 [Spongiibacteraceae bacterium]
MLLYVAFGSGALPPIATIITQRLQVPCAANELHRVHELKNLSAHYSLAQLQTFFIAPTLPMPVFFTQRKRAVRIGSLFVDPSAVVKNR